MSKQFDAPQLLAQLVEKAQEKKATELLSLELREISSICDYFLLMTVSNSRQAQALSDHLCDELKALGEKPLRVEGYAEGRWILIDFADVVVHIFLEEERRYYQLERLWGDAPSIQY